MDTYTINQIEDIRQNIENLVEEAFTLLEPGRIKESARNYWYGHIKNAVGEGGYSATTMQNTIQELLKESGHANLHEPSKRKRRRKA